MPNSHRPRRGGLIALAVLTSFTAALVGACGAVEPVATAVSSTPNAEPTVTNTPLAYSLTPTITLPPKAHGTPPSAPTPQSSDAYGLYVVADFGPPLPVGDYVAQYPLWVTGWVVDVLPAQWTTPEGLPPADPFGANPGVVYIMTPAIIALDGPALVNRDGADLSSGRIAVAVFGGQVGQDSVATTDPSQRLLAGEHVLLGLSRHPYMNGDIEAQFATPAGLAWNLSIKYVLAPDGLALQVFPGALPVATAELIAQIRAAASNP